jgi:hypothetical protein
MDGEKPTNIIVTMDSELRRNNVKLFINGKLEDTTGRAYDPGSAEANSNRWPFNVGMAGDGYTTAQFSIGNKATFYETFEAIPYKGKIEEVVYYPICIYPVDVNSGRYIFEKPLKELGADNTSKSYSAKLFVKDYHNIRGTTVKEVTSSTNVSWRKSTPLFSGD